ncbi:MAG TPA: phosphatase PAP2 family protein [Chitinophagaceae bacterium]|nr:phosphatase PAP2 family protein [Chitinophagaceae bacterium]
MLFVPLSGMQTREKRFWTGAALVSGEMVATMLLFTGAVVSFFFLTRERWRRYKKWDLNAFERVQRLVSPSNNRRMLFITALGKHQFLVPANLSVLGWYLFVRKHTWFSVRVVSIALSSLGLMLLFKKIFSRKRPANPLLSPVRGMSFPSGHAMMSTTFYGLLIYIITQKSGPAAQAALIPPLVLLILAVGFSRIYLRVHYTSDVLAGHTIGLAWLGLSLNTIRRLEAFNREQVRRLTSPG